MRDHAAKPAGRPVRRKPAPAARRDDLDAVGSPSRPPQVSAPERQAAILGLQRVGGNRATQRLIGDQARAETHPAAIARDPLAVRQGPDSAGVVDGPHTITDPQATLRDDPPDFRSTGKIIPAGTRVDLLDTQTASGKRVKGTFVSVTEHGGAALGWTLRDNLGDVHYAKAAASFVYAAKVQPRKGHPDAIPVMVYVPPGFDGKSADIVLYLHGDAADFSAGVANNYERENPAIGMQLAAHAGGPNQIVIAPQINEFSAAGGGIATKSPWHTLHPGDYESIVQTVLSNLQADLKAESPIARGAISIAGHSGGGKGLGQAAQDLDPTGGGVRDVTLVEAGYGGGEDKAGDADGPFAQSFQMVREWLLTGAPGKTLRVITKAGSPGTDTRSAIEKSSPKSKRIPVLSLEGVRNAIAAKGRDAELRAEATEVESDPEQRDGGMRLIRTIVVQPVAGGPPQGTIEVYLMLNPPRPEGVDRHFGVRNATLGAILAGQGKPGTFGVK